MTKRRSLKPSSELVDYRKQQAGQIRDLRMDVERLVEPFERANKALIALEKRALRINTKAEAEQIRDELEEQADILLKALDRLKA